MAAALPLAGAQFVLPIGYSFDICGSMDSVFRGDEDTHTEVLPIDGMAESTAGEAQGR